MKVKQLIKHLLDVDLDAEVYLSIAGACRTYELKQVEKSPDTVVNLRDWIFKKKSLPGGKV